MKKSILASALVVIATISTAMASEQSSKAPAVPAGQNKSSCTASKSTCSTTTAASCCSGAKAAKKNVDLKGAELLARR